MSVPVRPLTIKDAVNELLASIDSARCGTEVATALRQKAAELLRRVRPSSPGLTPQQRRYLIESGAFTPEEFAETEASVARGELREMEQRTSLAAVAASYGESEVAALLTISPEDVRRLYGEGKLYAFDAAGLLCTPGGSSLTRHQTADSRISPISSSLFIPMSVILRACMDS